MNHDGRRRLRVEHRGQPHDGGHSVINVMGPEDYSTLSEGDRKPGPEVAPHHRIITCFTTQWALSVRSSISSTACKAEFSHEE
jgi:hypothetical protein